VHVLLYVVTEEVGTITIITANIMLLCYYNHNRLIIVNNVVC